MWFAKSKAKKAIISGDLAMLKRILEENPKVLDAQMNFDSSNAGRLLNMAAYFDQPEIVEYLVKEKNADINRENGAPSRSTPLHHARMKKAYKAAAKLLELGADPGVTNAHGDNTRAFAREVRERDPVYVEQQRQERLALAEAERKAAAQRHAREAAEKAALIAGRWTQTAPAEITLERLTPNGRQQLTDVFNFETRIWRTAVLDIETKAMAQNIIFFDNMPDTAILQKPLQKLKELGAAVDENSLNGPRLAKQPLKPGLPGGK
jgi:hypothetical protein